MGMFLLWGSKVRYAPFSKHAKIIFRRIFFCYKSVYRLAFFSYLELLENDEKGEMMLTLNEALLANPSKVGRSLIPESIQTSDRYILIHPPPQPTTPPRNPPELEVMVIIFVVSDS